MSRLDAYLSAANFMLAGACEKLLSARVRALLMDRSIKYITTVYTRFYGYVHDATNGYASPSDCLTRTPDQLVTLLQ